LKNPGWLLFFIIVAAAPAWFMNKWMIKLTRPKESFGRLMLYFLVCVIFALAYSAICIFVFTRIYPLPKK
jgi:hypothetical protein